MPKDTSKYPSPDEFQDPLENFEPKTYDDPVERALAEETADAIQHQPVATIAADTAIADAVEKLAGFHVACLLVVEDDKLVGVFSDRDVLDKVALEHEQLKDHPVSEVMTRDPVYVYQTDPSAAALSVMAISGFRHVPILDLDEKLTGIVSPQRVTAFLQKCLGEEKSE